VWRGERCARRLKGEGVDSNVGSAYLKKGRGTGRRRQRCGETGGRGKKLFLGRRRNYWFRKELLGALPERRDRDVGDKTVRVRVG